MIISDDMMGVVRSRLEYHMIVGGGIPKDEQLKVAESDWLTVTMAIDCVDGGSNMKN